jgi:hypothetical protein
VFLLCDPGLLLPPDADDVGEHEQFWRRVVEWSSDKRVALGPEAHDLVIRHFESQGWPDYQPPRCPRGLGSLARGALNRLLASKREPIDGPVETPTLTPRYVRHVDGELAIAIDVTSNWNVSPVGLASADHHWKPQGTKVTISPPPPESIDLVTSPNAVTGEEREALVRTQMQNRRLNIVGGLRDEGVIARLEERFGLKGAEIRWIESSPGRDPLTDRLRGMRGHGDVLCCVIGCQGVIGLGHPGSQAAVGHARNRGVPHCKVERPSQIVDAITRLLAGADH